MRIGRMRRLAQHGPSWFLRKAAEARRRGLSVGLLWLAACVVMAVTPGSAYAHGVTIEYSSTPVVEIVARYDSGEPMAGAQVVVYAPDAPTVPWLTGTCDEEGRFSFSPDDSRPGTWAVQIRQAGHGGLVHIPVEEGEARSGEAGGYSVAQIALMSACVVWGIGATALYFRRRRS